MSARYLLRFDDICPTMDWQAWARIDDILQRHRIKPLLAVVADNRDPHLQVGAARSDFWDYIRRCQRQGWSIAMHGYQHLYQSAAPGLLGLNRHSEFSGLPREAQRAKIAQAASIFARERVRVNAWIAPGHNFDDVTLEILAEHGIALVSDGFYFRPVRHKGHVWLPQQLWRLRRMPFGTWTVCLHANGYSEAQIQAFERDVQRFARDIVDCAQALAEQPPQPASLLDHGFSSLWRAALLLKLKLASRHAPQPRPLA
ncbi:DUF2334 domain-containing protein [Pseudorhodoferax sp.]|uniref:DUF2334 domain-containing protein n=1 Tax=Pseudorhodoferax sp. TaxID=1993553 RepID=UPI002DD61BE2|nr:DUF2334 domain-containing protein [Pseudorhodoferax sp.]